MLKTLLRQQQVFFWIAFFLLGILGAQGQTEQENLDKYRYYRQRFNDYFIVIGNQPGESLVIGNRNRALTPRICFGQHGVQFGYYLGVLATEIALLERNQEFYQRQQSLSELDFALNAYMEQLDKCEHLFGFSDKLDGFFIRENVPVDFLDTKTTIGQSHFDKLNKGVSSEAVFLPDSGYYRGLKKGVPAYVDKLWDVKTQKETMSQDEAYGVMMGLALIAKFVPERAALAKQLFELITLHIIGKNSQNDCPNEGYVIKKPNCESISESTGGNTVFFGYGIAAAASKITEQPIENFYNKFSSKDFANSLKNYPLTGKFKSPIGVDNMYRVWVVCRNGIPGEQEWNRSMCATLAAIGDSWKKKTEKGLINNVYYTKGKKTHDWRTFYLSLWRSLHDKEINEEEKAMIQKELNSAPQYGPYNFKSKQFPDNFAKGGWAYTYRYRATTAEQFEGSTLVGIFNGLDYMLMYNLYQLLYAPSDSNISKYSR